MATEAASGRSIQCKHCQKSFNKGEHLRRHERSHTGSRPFQCKDCGRAFSRQDSLLRHQRLHTKNEFVPHPSPPNSNTESTPQSAKDSETVHTPWTDQSYNADISNNPDRESLSDSIRNRIDHAQAPLGNARPPLSSSAEIDFDLIWPDAEDLFHTITSPENANSWNMPLGALPLPTDLANIGAPHSSSAEPFPNRASSIGNIPLGGNHSAVHGVSKMITGLSSSVTAAAEASSITSIFLDECLHMFFVRFIPTFPILHRATFVFRDCTHPLLLNCIAIGSLYLGPKSAIAKGEALWRLAHVALTTSWETLIAHRGHYDTCKGVQLVVTALLSQTYAALSKNRTIRTTSQAFHALGFFWARHCGMFECEPYPLEDLPSLSAVRDEVERQWRRWAAREIQQRALLGHYILDGLIARMSGKPTCVRHSANQLSLASSEAIFEAGSAQQWLALMHNHHSIETSFRTIFRSIFQFPAPTNTVDYTTSSFSARVVVEGFQSLVLDCAEDDDDEAGAVGVPTKVEIRRALAQVHDRITDSLHIPTAEKQEVFLRWHGICLDACVNPTRLCNFLCARYSIEQNVWGGETGTGKPNFDLQAWAETPDAKRSLLHAVAIQELVENLPRGRAHVIHMPTALFTAATVYTAFALAGQTSVNLPSAVDWKQVLFSEIDPCIILAELSNPLHSSETQQFVHGQRLEPGHVGSGLSRNLLYELNSMQKLFRCLFSQWGIAYDMEAIIDQWISLCH